MSSSVAGFGVAKEKAGRVPQHRVKYALFVGGLCWILGALWMRSSGAVWRLWWEAEGDRVEQPLTEWHGAQPAPDWHPQAVNISILTDAVDEGAVCLDGSPPAYYLENGTGEGVNNWLIFLEGGAWCSSDMECYQRSFTPFGSSRYMARTYTMKTILSGSPTENPDFYNWNRVLVKYCDGGSFSGDATEPAVMDLGHHLKKWGKEKGKKKAALVFYRGQRIWKAVMENLLEIGMRKAERAFLAGCSAGGLASILHCDQYRDLMPKESSVKCLSDAGFFVNLPDISGVKTIESFFANVVLLHNMTGSLPGSCTSERNVTQCMFPEFSIKELRTPLFMLSPAYDFWQFNFIVVPESADPERNWVRCRGDISACSESQLRAAEDFRLGFFQRLEPLIANEKHGAFIYSCYSHCQSHTSWSDTPFKSPRIDNKTIAQVVGDWYFERNVSKVIDRCPYPCNPTCT